MRVVAFCSCPPSAFSPGKTEGYNMLVPLDCPLYDEYRQVRGNIALETDELHAINTSGQDRALPGWGIIAPFLGFRV